MQHQTLIKIVPSIYLCVPPHTHSIVNLCTLPDTSAYLCTSVCPLHTHVPPYTSASVCLCIPPHTSVPSMNLYTSTHLCTFHAPLQLHIFLYISMYLCIPLCASPCTSAPPCTPPHTSVPLFTPHISEYLQIPLHAPQCTCVYFYRLLHTPPHISAQLYIPLHVSPCNSTHLHMLPQLYIPSIYFLVIPHTATYFYMYTPCTSPHTFCTPPRTPWCTSAYLCVAHSMNLIG